MEGRSCGQVGSHFSSRFEGEKIPSLEEVLEACKGRIRLNIELKSIGTKSPLPEVVTEMIKEMGMEDQCVITSVSLDYLKRVKEADPELKTGYILAAAYGSYYKNESDLQCRLCAGRGFCYLSSLFYGFLL